MLSSLARTDRAPVFSLVHGSSLRLDIASMTLTWDGQPLSESFPGGMDQPNHSDRNTPLCSSATVIGWASQIRKWTSVQSGLPDDTLGNAVGWFRYGAFTDQGIPGLMAYLAGYPSAQKPMPFTCPDEAIGFMGCQLWFAADRIREATFNEIIQCQPPDPCTVLRKGIVSYPIDTSGGQSGSPVWCRVGVQRVVVAIHTLNWEHPECSNTGGENNCGTLLTTTVADLFEYWGAAPRLPSIWEPCIAEAPPTPLSPRVFLPLVLRNH